MRVCVRGSDAHRPRRLPVLRCHACQAADIVRAPCGLALCSLFVTIKPYTATAAEAEVAQAEVAHTEAVTESEQLATDAQEAKTETSEESAEAKMKRVVDEAVRGAQTGPAASLIDYLKLQLSKVVEAVTEGLPESCTDPPLIGLSPRGVTLTIDEFHLARPGGPDISCPELNLIGSGINTGLKGLTIGVNEALNTMLNIAAIPASLFTFELGRIPCVSLVPGLIHMSIADDTLAIGIGREAHSAAAPAAGTSRICIDSVKTNSEREGVGLQGTEYYALIELEGAPLPHLCPSAPSYAPHLSLSLLMPHPGCLVASHLGR